jgi:predicted nucleic acid-binding protein
MLLDTDVMVDVLRQHRAYRDFAAFRLSHGIDLLDVLIAQTAVGLNEPLATFNVTHFSPIAALQTIQPY